MFVVNVGLQGIYTHIILCRRESTLNLSWNLIMESRFVAIAIFHSKVKKRKWIWEIFFPMMPKIGKQLASLVKLMELRFESAMTEFQKLAFKLQLTAGTNNPEAFKIIGNLNRVHKNSQRYKDALDNLSKSKVMDGEKNGELHCDQ